MGDLTLFAEEIAEHSLLHPILVTTEFTLIAGERRLSAVKQLGWDEIPVHIVPLKNIVEGEFAENAFRKNFTPSEAVAIARVMKPILAERAKERQKEAGRVGGKAAGRGRPKAEGGVKLTDPYKGKTREILEAGTGMSFATLDKASLIVAAAERDPERYADLKERMDKTRKVHPVYRELHQRLEDDGGTLEALKGAETLGKQWKDAEETGKKFNFTNESIEWARWTWNPVTGCEHGCPYCYARDIANRFYTDMPAGERFKPRFRENRLRIPHEMKVPKALEADPGARNVFVCSMADLFGEWVPDGWITQILKVCKETPDWTYIFLTKNPKRLPICEFPHNSWVGATVDTQARVEPTIQAMEDVQATIRFISCEPLTEDLTLPDLSGIIDWVVIGAQSKTASCPEFQPEWQWVRHVEAQARNSGCSVYFKHNLALKKIRPKEYPTPD